MTRHSRLNSFLSTFRRDDPCVVPAPRENLRDARLNTPSQIRRGGFETRPRNTKDAGFTLIEIMVSLALIGLILPAVLFAFSNSAHSRVKADGRILAANLLRDKISEMEALGLPDVGSEEGEFQEGSRFRWQTEVSETETEGLRDVVVRVLWVEAGVEKEFAIHTQMADKALSQTGGTGQQQAGGAPPL